MTKSTVAESPTPLGTEVNVLPKTLGKQSLSNLSRRGDQSNASKLAALRLISEADIRIEPC